MLIILYFIVSLFYQTTFKSYSSDYHPTTDIKYLFWTRGQFANQVTILDLHATESRNCISVISLCQ